MSSNIIYEFEHYQYQKLIGVFICLSQPSMSQDRAAMSSILSLGWAEGSSQVGNPSHFLSSKKVSIPLGKTPIVKMYLNQLCQV